jgi:Flavodoxin domain
MTAFVVYESVYGNTRQIAAAVARGLAVSGPVELVPVAQLKPGVIGGADLVVVGGPTHAWSMSRPKTRTAAIEGAGKPNSGLTVEPDAAESGVREWLAALADKPKSAAAFDTRIKMPAVFSGSAARRIHQELRRKGVFVFDRASFLVTKQNHLVDGETERAEQWGRELASQLARRTTSGKP